MFFHTILIALICLFFAVTFLESGIDKALNYQANLSWLKSHFEKTFLKPAVPFLMLLTTIQEIIVGVLMLIAIYTAFASCCDFMIKIAIAMALFVLIQLFAGQRIAKDYAGASGIIPYILVAILGLFILNQ